MKCWNGDHDELRRGDFIYRGAAGMGVLDEMKKTQGAAFSLKAVNLAELQRMTGISRAKLRRLKENQFETLPDKRCGRKAPKTKLTGYTDYIRSHRYLIPPKRHVVIPQ